MNDQQTVEPAQLSIGQLAFLRHALAALGRAGTRWATLVMSFALFAWACWKPEPWRILTASFFTALVHVPLWWRARE